MKICNDCKKELPDDSDFCQYCGSKNVSVYNPKPINLNYKRCIDCGKELPSDSDFCQYCGSKRVAMVNNSTSNNDSSSKSDGTTGKFKKLFIVATIVAICSLCGLAYYVSMYNDTNLTLETYKSKNESLEKQIKTKDSELSSARRKASNYDDVISYSKSAVGYSDFYARDTILYKPNKQKVWIYQGFYSTMWAQTSSGTITTEWGNWSGNWVPLTITYSGSGVEYVKIYNEANSKYFYIIVIG